MSSLNGIIEGGVVEHSDGSDNPPSAIRYKIDLSGFVERHLCACDHCREVSGAPIHDILVVTKEAFEITQGEERLVTTKTKPLCRREHLDHTGCQLTIYVDAEGFDSLVLVHMPTVDKKDQEKVPKPGRIVFLEDSTMPGDFWSGLNLPMYEGWVGHADTDSQALGKGYMPSPLSSD
jgi:hypothetical protein